MSWAPLPVVAPSEIQRRFLGWLQGAEGYFVQRQPKTVQPKIPTLRQTVEQQLRPYFTNYTFNGFIDLNILIYNKLGLHEYSGETIVQCNVLFINQG